MKSIGLASLIIVFASIVSKSEAQRDNLDIGLNGGATISRVKGESFFNPVPDRLVYYYAFGGTIQYNFPKTFAVQSGLTYEKTGTDDAILSFWDDNFNSIHSAVIISNLNFIRIPVTGKASFGNKTKFFVGSGGYVGYLAGISNEFVSEDLNFKPKTDSLYKKFDFGLTLNAGLSIPIMDKLSVSTEVRYSRGISKIGNATYIYYHPVRTSSLALLLGLAYGLGSRKS